MSADLPAGRLPEVLDAWRMVAAGRRFEGVLPLAAMPRLKGSLLDTEGAARVVVEFGRDSVRARAVTAGGQSGDPASKHFTDQAIRYATGDLRPVYFYRSQLAGHIEREYHPGQ